MTSSCSKHQQLDMAKPLCRSIKLNHQAAVPIAHGSKQHIGTAANVASRNKKNTLL